jgi:hypothetical protein
MTLKSKTSRDFYDVLHRKETDNPLGEKLIEGKVEWLLNDKKILG